MEKSHFAILATKQHYSQDYTLAAKVGGFVPDNAVKFKKKTVAFFQPLILMGEKKTLATFKHPLRVKFIYDEKSLLELKPLVGYELLEGKKQGETISLTQDQIEK